MTRALTADPIPAYLTELRATLYGSRRKINDMLREARGGIEDATDAYLAEGIPPDEAARRAVEEFGTVAEVAPAYQVELAATVTRRALVFLALLVPVGNIAAWLQWKDAPALSHEPPPGTYALSLTVDILAWLVVAVAVVAALGLTFGSRYVEFKPEYARMAAVGILSVLVATLVSGLALSVLYAMARGLQPWALTDDTPGVAYILAWSGLTFSGLRCLRTGRRAERLRDAVTA